MSLLGIYCSSLLRKPVRGQALALFLISLFTVHSFVFAGKGSKKKQAKKIFHAEVVRYISLAPKNLIGHNLNQLIGIEATGAATEAPEDWQSIIAALKEKMSEQGSSVAKKARKAAAGNDELALLALVQWRDYDSSEASFEPLENIITGPEFLCQWNTAWSTWWDEAIGDTWKLDAFAEWLAGNPAVNFFDPVPLGFPARYPAINVELRTRVRAITHFALGEITGTGISTEGHTIAAADPLRVTPMHEGIQVFARTIQIIEGRAHFVWENYEELNALLGDVSMLMGRDRALLNLCAGQGLNPAQKLLQKRLFHSFMLGSPTILEEGDIAPHFEAGQFNVPVPGRIAADYFESRQHKLSALFPLSSKVPHLISPAQLWFMKREAD